MPFTLQHILVSERLEPFTHETTEGTYFTVAAQGKFTVPYPGRMRKNVVATVRHSMRIDTPEMPTGEPPFPIEGGHPQPQPQPVPQPLHSGVQVTTEGIPLKLRIFDPDGNEFTRDEVTIEDLRKFRDLRGTPRGHWLYTLQGRSRTYTLVEALHETVSDPKGVIELNLLETVAPESAAPLVGGVRLDGSRQKFQFDLNRVGTFVARIVPSSPFHSWHGSMQLFDPDGINVGGTSSRQLRREIPLAALGKSRDAAGRPRPWTLEVSPQVGIGDEHVSATVIGAGRISTDILHDRIEDLIGPEDRSYIELIGENRDGQARAVLTIKDIIAAEAIDMHGLLDSQLKKQDQPTSIEANKPIILFSDSENLDHGLRLDVSSVKLRSIGIAIGPGEGLGADTPAIKLLVKAHGEVKVKWGPATLADAKLRDGHLKMEVGIRLDAGGTPRVVTWVRDDPFDIDMNNGVVAALVVALGVLGGVTAVGIAEYVEEVVNDRFAEGAADLFDDPSLAPRILMTIFGAHLTYLPVRFEGDDIVFGHIAPLEPDPKPRPNYQGAIGRSVRHEGALLGGVTFRPMVLGDTWKADNLAHKIDHIVAVMMENRSYDHVLGYRARAPINDGADGLTDAVVASIQATDEHHLVRPLRNAGFEPNVLGLRTRIPKGVGHELEDVRQQLGGTIDGPDGRRINDPKGFVDNFKEKLGTNPDNWADCVPDDVLGYYEKVDAEGVNDLPIFAYLAEHYAYCDRYFCSHPGPTLPNRMYSLTGDVQYDRLGVPILDNNHGDNFLLSRAETIYDLLTKQGISWRVYESNPSVTMLRMFARYATDDVNIRKLERLETDIANGDLPKFTFVEPAMHHHPQDDDHPDADMYRGQIFIRRVYQALRSKSEVWRKTLLIITYDEHGGLYDHVVPPIADVLNAPLGPVVSDGFDEQPTGGGHGFGSDHIAVNPAVTDVVIADPEAPEPQPQDPTIQIPYGVRVPTFVVSPWTMRGKGPNITLDHCSILKTVLARFCGGNKPFLNDRIRASRSFESFLTEDQPRMDVPAPPTLGELPLTVRLQVPGASEIVTPPLFRKQMREGPVDYHELSGRLARMLGR